MIMWPYADRLFVEPRTPTRPVYDIPPVIVGSPRWPLLRARSARLAARRAAGECEPGRSLHNSSATSD